VKELCKKISDFSKKEDYSSALQILYENILPKNAEQDYVWIENFMDEFIQHEMHIKIYVGLLAVTKYGESTFIKRPFVLEHAYSAARKTISDEKRVQTLLNNF